jgi:hypothetical protein
MFQEVAKKSGDGQPAARRHGLPARSVLGLGAAGRSGPGPGTLHAPLTTPFAH